MMILREEKFETAPAIFVEELVNGKVDVCCF